MEPNPLNSGIGPTVIHKGIPQVPIFTTRHVSQVRVEGTGEVAREPGCASCSDRPTVYRGKTCSGFTVVGLLCNTRPIVLALPEH